jgi:hypothetical protein
MKQSGGGKDLFFLVKSKGDPVNRLPPPPPPLCLTKSYESRGVKGGTVIAEDVWDSKTHAHALLDPDNYRRYIGPCRACGYEKVHALCFRTRTLRPADPSAQRVVEDVRLFRCPQEGCGAVYTVLPAFVARHLWRAWQTVEKVCDGREPAPSRTTERWLGRLGSAARQLVQRFKASVLQTLNRIVSQDWVTTLSEDLTRWGFIALLQGAGAVAAPRAFAQVAAWVHRVEAGVRLM